MSLDLLYSNMELNGSVDMDVHVFFLKTLIPEVLFMDNGHIAFDVCPGNRFFKESSHGHQF